MKRKRILAALLALATMLALAGCGSKEEKAVSGESDTLTYWVDMNRSIASHVQTMAETPFYKEVEKKTGVKIEFVHPPLGQAGEQFNLMVASQTMYDFVEYNWFKYAGGPQKAIEDGVILKLNDYIDANAPNFKKIISEGEYAEIYRKNSLTDSGAHFAFPTLNTGNYRTFGGPIIRKDWLDELGLSVPETIDEWTTVLRAFKEKKGAEAPLTGLSGYFLIGGHAFNGGYGIGKGLYLDGKTVKFGVLEPQFKDYVQQMHEWYKEGLLDSGFATADKKIIASNMTKGKSGAAIAFIGSEMGNYLSQMEGDETYNLAAAPYPAMKKGETSKFVAMEQDVPSNCLAISAKCAQPEKAVKWADFWYGEEGYMLLNFGIEGESYVMENDKPVYTDTILRNPDGYSISETLGLYTRATGPAPGINQAPEYLEQYYQYPQQVEAFKLWAKATDGARKSEIPASIMPAIEESEEYTALEADINTYCEEMVLKFIIGEEPMSKFDDFVKQLKTQFNVERYIQIKQDAYNRYLKR